MSRHEHVRTLRILSLGSSFLPPQEKQRELQAAKSSMQREQNPFGRSR
jgi:hypothetical protein